MDTSADGRECFQALVPSENIVVPVSLSSSGLYYGNTREETPIELVVVRRVYELIG
jgi:hypothetical protein